MGLGLLPTELLIHIFSYLERRDLKAARGVCSSFRDNASPDLFRSVVACQRYKAMSALQSLSQRAIYNTYVKEIVFDASIYARFAASSWANYAQQEKGHPDFRDHTTWDQKNRYKRYRELYEEQEDIRDGLVFLHTLARSLEDMQNVATIIYSPGPRHIPIEAKFVKDTLPRSYSLPFMEMPGMLPPAHHPAIVDSVSQPLSKALLGFHHLIAAVQVAQYTGIKEFRAEPPERDAKGYVQGSEFGLILFSFPDQLHLEAGRYFFSQLHKIDIHMALELPLGREVPAAKTLLANFAAALAEARELRSLALHLGHFRPGSDTSYNQAIAPDQPIFPYLGLSNTWSKLCFLSLGGITATEQQLLKMITRHRDTLASVDFVCCSIMSGAWANVVDEVVFGFSNLLLSLDKVNEMMVDDTDFRDLPEEEQDKWLYEGQISVNSDGERYFAEPSHKSVYASRSPPSI